MKSGDIYRFTLAWPMDTEERILAGEFLGKLGNKKSRFIVHLIYEYLTAHPEAVNPKETIQLVVNAPSVGDMLTEKIRSIIQTELAGKTALQQSGEPDSEKIDSDADADGGIEDMLDNLDMWNIP